MSGTPVRIGLFGGSFNPPHLGHLALARAVRDQLALDEVRWLPAGQPWQKAGQLMASGSHRATMVQRLIADEPRMVLDARELARSGPSYTLDTVRACAAEQPQAEWFLLLGQDQVAGLPTWHGLPDLLAQVTLAVAARAGRAPELPPAVAALGARQVVVALPRIDVSASQVRHALASGSSGADVAPWVGEPVARYIAEHNLYRA